MKFITFLIGFTALVVAVCCLNPTVFADTNDWATEVVEYVQGNNTVFGYTNPVVALGEAAKKTIWDQGTEDTDIKIFLPAFYKTDLVSIGDGGHLTLKTGRKIMNEEDDVHLYGVDLTVYGNMLFACLSESNVYASPWYSASWEPAEIWVSQDSTNWCRATGISADSFFPTQSIDSDGNPSDYLSPVNPALLTNDWLSGNWSYTNTVDAYDGAAGGAPVDLSLLEDEHGNPTNLPWIQYIKFFDIYDGEASEIDAVAAVRELPEPFSIFCILCSVFIFIFKYSIIK